MIHIAEPVLGGARTLGKLDESSTGARLSAQMLGGQVKMHIGVIGMQSLAYDALFSLCTQKLLSLYGPKEDMSVHSNQRQRSLDMHCLFVYLRIPCLSVLSVWRRYGPRTWKLLWKKDMRLAAVTELVPINTNIPSTLPIPCLSVLPCLPYCICILCVYAAACFGDAGCVCGAVCVCVRVQYKVC